MTQINLLPWREQARQIQKIRFGLLIAMVIVAAIIVIIMMNVFIKSSIRHSLQRMDYLQLELGNESGVLMDLLKKEKAQIAVVSELNFILSIRKKSFSAIQLLNTLAHVVPDAVTFNKVIRANNSITIFGKATSNLQITLLMKNIKDSKFFNQPNLKEITGRENMSGNERFFQLTVEQPE